MTPFEDAKALLEARGAQNARLIEPTSFLPVFGTQLFTYVARRHATVHDVATRLGRMARESISDLQARFDREQLHGFAPNPMPEDDASWTAAQEALTNELRSEIDRSAREIIGSYRLLISASNAVFQVEYWSRALAR